MFSIKHRLASFALATAVFMFAAPGFAATVTYNFGAPLNSDSPAPPSSSFATLAVDTDTWVFTLHALDALTDFGSSAFISALAIDGALSGGISISNVTSGSGVTVSYAPGGGPGGAFDFRSAFPTKKSDRLMANEWVQWTVSGLSSINALGLHVQSIGSDGDSGWYGPSTTPTPVPLPASIWLLGSALLGLMGLGRRKLQS